MRVKGKQLQKLKNNLSQWKIWIIHENKLKLLQQNCIRLSPKTLFWIPQKFMHRKLLFKYRMEVAELQFLD